jgi:multiple sugar transport system permease protein
MTASSAAAPRARRAGRSGRRRAWVRGTLFSLPFLVGFVVLIAYPVLASARYSFTDFNLFQSPTWVGLQNYRDLFADSSFLKALVNTLLLTVVGVPLTIALALAGAWILNLPVRGQPVYRALVYLPTIVPAVVGGYLWRWLLNTEYGYIDYVLGLLHLPQPAWLTEPAWGKPAIILMSLWTVGGTTLIYLAALKDVPEELYEAAALDGAGPWRRFWAITWPSITPVTLFQVIVTIIAFLQIFNQPYLLTQTASAGSAGQAAGGPGQSMLTYGVYIFDTAFRHLRMGYASAMAWILFLITLAVTAVLLLTSKKWVHDGDK